jgi:hypothetical protein
VICVPTPLRGSASGLAIVPVDRDESDPVEIAANPALSFDRKNLILTEFICEVL